MDAAEIIERAADIMQERGKAGPDAVDGRDHLGRLCVVRSIARAAHKASPEAEDRAIELIRQFAHPQFLINWSDFNDEATVLAGMRAVAATLRAQQAAPVAEPAKVQSEPNDMYGDMYAELES